MRFLWILQLISLLCIYSTPISATEKEGMIVGIIDSVYNANEILLPYVGETWVGLYKNGDNFSLQKIDLEKNRVTEYGRTYDKITALHTTNSETSLKYLFRNIQGINENKHSRIMMFNEKYSVLNGSVWTSHGYINNSGWVFPGESRYFHGRESDDGVDTFLVANGISIGDYPKCCFENYTIMVNHEGAANNSSLIYTTPRACNSFRPKLILAGDLDGDLVTDFLFTVPSKDNWKEKRGKKWEYILYLSLHAFTGKFKNGVLEGTLVQP